MMNIQFSYLLFQLVLLSEAEAILYLPLIINIFIFSKYIWGYFISYFQIILPLIIPTEHCLMLRFQRSWDLGPQLHPQTPPPLHSSSMTPYHKVYYINNNQGHHDPYSYLKLSPSSASALTENVKKYRPGYQVWKNDSDLLHP